MRVDTAGFACGSLASCVLLARLLMEVGVLLALSFLSHCEPDQLAPQARSKEEATSCAQRLAQL